MIRIFLLVTHRDTHLSLAYYLQLKDSLLFKQDCYVNGEWVKATSGKTFEVTGLSRFCHSTVVD